MKDFLDELADHLILWFGNILVFLLFLWLIA